MPEAPLISIIRCDSPNERGSSVHNRNYLIYIATRDGVDLTDVELERELKNMERENQSDHADNEQYLKYIHHRPGSQGLFGNVDVSDPVKLGNEIADLTAEGRLIYRGIISLREDDAVNLGFDKKEAWVDYMNQVMPDVAQEFNIPVDKLQWTAAFHIKNGHPHCHYMFWNKEPQVGSPYIHPSKNVRCRELLSKEMFHLEREQYVIDKTLARDFLIDATKDFVQDEISLLLKKPEKLTGFFQTKDVRELSKELLTLTAVLPKTGRLKYGFLPPECKKELDAVVDRMLQKQPLSTEYYRYMMSMDAISVSYSASEEHMKVTSDKADQDIRKRMANKILDTCKCLLKEKELLSQYYPDAENTAPAEPSVPDEPIDLPSAFADAFSDESDIQAELPEDITSIYTQETYSYDNAEHGSASVNHSSTKAPVHETNSFEADNSYVIEWSKEYKAAMKMLYDEEITDKSETIALLQKEAGCNNVLAFQALGRIFENGIFIEKNEEKANQYYTDAFKGFSFCLNKPKYEKLSPYIHYRLGRLYENGQGTEQDYEKAIASYKAAPDNKYAQYALGSMYFREKGIEITPDTERDWYIQIAALYKASADQDFPYAAYAYAKLCEDNPKYFSLSAEEISSYYSNALNGFLSMLKEQKNDDLLYRIGTMYYRGKGTEKDQDEAYKYFVMSAEYNNANAQYALGKTYADPDTKYYDPEKAIEMFLLSHEQGNIYATLALGNFFAAPGNDFNPAEAVRYFNMILEELPEQVHFGLGKLYSQPETDIQDISVAIQHFEISASEYNNCYAQYALAKLLLDEKSSFYSFAEGFDWLMRSAENENSYAQAKLGNMFLWGTKDLAPDIQKAEAWLLKAVDLGNSYAMLSLGNLYSNPDKLFNPLKALECYNSILNEFPAEANYALGKLYAVLDTPVSDLGKAVYHLQVSANLDYSNAQYSLAKLLLDEKSVYYNFNEGFHWLTHSAEAGNAFSQAKLGSMYLWGAKNLKADPELGKIWLNKSLEQGNTYAQEILNMYANYRQDIAVGLSFGLCRNLLHISNPQHAQEDFQSIVSRVRSKEAIVDQRKKEEQTR